MTAANLPTVPHRRIAAPVRLQPESAQLWSDLLDLNAPRAERGPVRLRAQLIPGAAAGERRPSVARCGRRVEVVDVQGRPVLHDWRAAAGEPVGLARTSARVRPRRCGGGGGGRRRGDHRRCKFVIAADVFIG